MLANWIYGVPIWLVGAVITALAVLASWGGLILVYRWVPEEVRQAHNDALYYMGQTVGVLVTILLALVAVAVWQNFSRGDDVAALEAGRIGNLLRDSAGLPESVRAPVRARLKSYTDVVIGEEWPAQRAGRVQDASFRKGWRVLGGVDIPLARYQPGGPGQAAVEGEMLRALDELYDARRSRILAAQAHLPAVVWTIMAIGAAMTVGCTFFFGMPRIWVHLLMTGAVAASLSLVFVLIIALDYPFRGALSVSTDAYQAVRELNFGAPPRR